MAIAPLRLPRDRDALEAHFAALSSEDLRLRFGQTMKPETVAAYLDSVEARRAPIFGTVNRNLDVVAVGQFADTTDGLEVGLSVLSRYRRRGLATALLERAASYARAHSMASLVMHCLADNAPMLALARHFGMAIERVGSEADGRLKLRAGTAVDVWTDAAYDQAGIIDAATKRWQLALRNAPADLIGPRIAQSPSPAAGGGHESKRQHGDHFRTVIIGRSTGPKGTHF